MTPKRTLLRLSRNSFKTLLEWTSTFSFSNIVYNSQGKYDEAISYYERALKIYDREFGTDHINSAGIGNVYKFARQVRRGDFMLRSSAQDVRLRIRSRSYQFGGYNQ